MLRLAITMMLLSFTFPQVMGAVSLYFPLGRTAYQDNEYIDVALGRSEAATTATSLAVTLSDDAGYKMNAGFEIPAGNTTLLFRVNSALLRPAGYNLRIAAGEDANEIKFSVHSQIRWTNYPIIDWGGHTTGAAQLNVSKSGCTQIFTEGKPFDDYTVRAGLDAMNACALGGGHQPDFRMENDWSDANVLPGMSARTSRSALRDRTIHNVFGVHFFDEPGLTWANGTPINVPVQDALYLTATGKKAISGAEAARAIRESDEQVMKEFSEFMRWRLQIMDAAWNLFSYNVSRVSPRLVGGTQSVYGAAALSDGYYFNINRSFPAIYGHGGYDSWGPGIFHPSWTMLFARARDNERPMIYMPAWDVRDAGNLRAEYYLSFLHHANGLMFPPGFNPGVDNTPGHRMIREISDVVGKIGPAMNNFPVQSQDVAMLYSASNNLRLVMSDTKNSSMFGGFDQIYRNQSLYLANLLIQQPTSYIVEEDLLDGSVSLKHKVILIGADHHLDRNVITALESFIAHGGTVIINGETKYAVRGAQKFNFSMKNYLAKNLLEPGKMPQALDGLRPLADELRKFYQAAGILPAFVSDNQHIVAGRENDNDVEYLFAVNATPIANTVSVAAAKAMISLTDDGRPVYDALRSTTALFTAVNGKLQAQLDFIPGEMKVWVRTARPIGSVALSKPKIAYNYTRDINELPAAISFTAAVCDDDGKPFTGAIPLKIIVLDPAGNERYNLYRATKEGVCTLNLPWGVNEPVGKWTVSVQELLSGKKDDQEMIAANPFAPGALLGLKEDAFFFEEDRQNIFQFMRSFTQLTIVTGDSDAYGNVVNYLVNALASRHYLVNVVSAKKIVENPKIFTAEQSGKPWVGMETDVTGKPTPGPLDPRMGGFNIKGATILIGTPDNHPMIKFMADRSSLPYKVTAMFPGKGRGYIAWQRDMISYGDESVTLIANDEAGIMEAARMLYQISAGLRPLTPVCYPDAIKE